MTTFTIDNQHIIEALDDGESYTPASGSVQKVTVTAEEESKCEIDGVRIKQGFVSGGANEGRTFPLIIDDTTTISFTREGGVVSGFVIN